MTNNEASATLTTDDPRFAFARVTDAVGALIEGTSPELLTNPTPCPDYTVQQLLEHCVLVARRVAAIGRGEHWSSLTEQAVDSGWSADYRAAAHDIMLAWTDPALLDQTFEVPWAEIPGSVLMYSYTAELAVHGWDIAQATSQPFSIDDELLGGALMAAKFIPAEGRESVENPFGPVVDPGTDASVLDQLAGWMGRNVLP